MLAWNARRFLKTAAHVRLILTTTPIHGPLSRSTTIPYPFGMADWSRIIAAGVGPIIVISACGLLCLALYNRLAAVVTRLRAFHRERLHEQEALNHARKQVPADETAMVMHLEVLGMLETQTRHVTRRAKLIRNALACLLACVACLAI